MAIEWTCNADVRRLLGADVLYSAVAARRGPHLTPTAFSWSAGRLWVIAPRASVKAKTLRRDPRIGLLISEGEQSLLGSGTARVVDPLSFGAWGPFGELSRMPAGALSYLAGNTRHFLGVVADQPSPLLLVDRVVLSITVHRLALVGGDRVIEAWGEWPRANLLTDEPVPDAARWSLDELPDLLTQGGSAQIGVQTVDGPAALPGSWASDGHSADTGAELATLVGMLPDGPVCVSRSTAGYRMDDKRGVLLRGDGTATLAGAQAHIQLTPERLTTWQGRHTSTVEHVKSP
ncbi:pyridoxamine 5'-phosphate oxidase family protein [Pseudonocardia spinosispora]|uniref:pyridoxamine 5'-phosphate oxidase family protein n=1 Tax=Pseudonocardia spinosispora TaxID=103441 RepID=UPI0003F7D350|nr:pyridoxamine 5'-phosphate oxidase family protein [Pseudonocardia spinosispora]